ncbi:Gag-Pol polyprotein [Elysia marginata]|uniref:Gag-Pol polyprotein n=1 Tax=Elysia marginata TaxID=1093978 RepID=A0AAV4I058_9GAST|nr:Gag-Pol polyprotein [Elysia marginata]
MAAEQEHLKDAPHKAEKMAETLILQWIPGHYKIDGTEKADRLARKRSDLEQLNDDLSYHKVKHKVKSHKKERWKTRHPHHNIQDDLQT